ncbi:MAG: hypothetical protein JWN70_2396 [Planctomycetaceae bacterium]|nr:hypothetical protein [Planctomycetaceae bacterium]
MVDGKGHREQTGGNPTGFCCAIRDNDNRIKPVVFVRQNIVLATDGDNAEEVKAALRLLVLLHELGHAEDIVKGVNFNHTSISWP